MFNEYSRFSLENREVPPEVVEQFPVLFNHYKDALFKTAVTYESQAKHHSNVRVGCSMLMINKNLDLAEPYIISGSNTKLSKAMMAWPDRECAESRAFLNALNIKRPEAIDDPNWQGMDIGMQEGGLKEGGVVTAILAVSHNSNTGELDRAGHDVLISCDQCIVNYEGLMKLGIVNKNTIVYNARIEDGKEVAFVQERLEQLVEGFYKKKEIRDQSIIDRLQTSRQEALDEYQRELSNINLQFGSPNENPVPPVMPEDVYGTQRGRQRERVEAVYEVLNYCIKDIIKAAEGAAERGLSKQKIIEVLVLPNFKFDNTTQKLTKVEIGLISDKLQEGLFKIYHGHE